MNLTTERVDRRYSDERAQAVPWADAEARLVAAEVAWVVTVRPDGHPHATPMVPVVLDGRVCFQTAKREVKCTNLEGNPHVLVLAGDTDWDRGLDVAVEDHRPQREPRQSGRGLRSDAQPGVRTRQGRPVRPDHISPLTQITDHEGTS